MNRAFKDDVYDALAGHGVKYVDVSSRSVDVYASDREEPHVFPLTPDTNFDELVKSIKQHLRNRT